MPPIPPPETLGTTSAQPDGAQPSFNPLVAQKDVDVGTFYLKRGDVDAAIDRYTEATRTYPTYAQPWLLLGQAYEKKGDLDSTIKAYQKYLQLYPHAPTRAKLESHIAELQTKLQRETQKPAGK